MADSQSPITTPEFKQRFAALGRLSDVDTEVLLGALRRELFTSGSAIVAPDTDNDSLYLIWSGRVRVTLDAEQVVAPLGQFGPGDWIGEMAVIDPCPATATVTAVDDCLLLVLSHARFLALRRGNPALTSVLLQTFSRQLTARLRHTLQHLHGEQMPGAGQRGWLLNASRRLLGIAARSAT